MFKISAVSNQWYIIHLFAWTRWPSKHFFHSLHELDFIILGHPWQCLQSSKDTIMASLYAATTELPVSMFWDVCTWIASVGWFSLKSMLELSILVFSFSIELCSVFSLPLDLLILKSTFLQVSRKTILYSKRMFLLLLSCHHHQRHQLCVASWFLSEAMSKKNSHLFFFSISFNYGHQNELCSHNWVWSPA